MNPSPPLARMLLALPIVWAACTATALSAEAGQAAPALSLPAGGGATVTLAQHLGKVVYLDFWASWCGPCRQSFPWMNAMQSRYGAQGLVVIGVNVDANPADAEQFLAQLPAQFAVGFDPKGQTARAYGVKGMPTSVLIGRDGKVISQHAGFSRSAAEPLEAAIAAALGDRK